MPAFLTFALAAPLASMGALAVGERRDGWSTPARSALLGLFGACLGVLREDEAGQAALAEAFGSAVLVESAGRPLTDYHTVQVPPRSQGRFHTRRAELGAAALNTILTWREYRQEVLCLGAAWTRSGGRWPLEALEAAMRRPTFVPSFGRKSCPLGLPLGPRLLHAQDPARALAMRRRTGPERVLRAACGPSLPRAESPVVALDAMDAEAFGLAGLRRTRRDVPISRARWQFGLRGEALVPLPAAGLSEAAP